MDNTPIIETIHTCPTCGNTDWIKLDMKKGHEGFKCKHCEEFQSLSQMEDNSSKRLVRDENGKYAIPFPVNLLHTVIAVLNYADVIAYKQADIHHTKSAPDYARKNHTAQYKRLIDFIDNVDALTENDLDNDEIARIRLPFGMALGNEQNYEQNRDKDVAFDVMLDKQDAQDAYDLMHLITTIMTDAPRSAETELEANHIMANNSMYGTILESYKRTVAFLFLND